MIWTQQQGAAIKTASAWARQGRGSQQVFRMFGFAGVGKTTLARAVAQACGGEALFIAPTGKAALMLRKRGCSNASTMHSAIYKPLEDEVTGKVTYRINPDSPITTAQLVVLDESSMADDEVSRDLLSFGVKVLALGDPYQLPPVRGTGFFTSAEPDIMLTEIHRQAADNPIIRMTMDIREGRGLKPGRYGDSQVLVRGDVDREAMREMVLGADQVLVGMNRTRMQFNRRTRELKGMPGAYPVPGERLICLRNNRTKGLMNGGMWEVRTARHQVNMVRMVVDSLDDEERGLDVQTPVHFFEGREKELDWRVRKQADEFDFGYAITVHKAQGSQWDNVLLFDESSVFREDADRHLYTAASRASERLTVIMD